MARILTPVVAFGALAAATALNAAEIEIASEGPVVELSIFESINVAPDVATVFSGVTSDAPTATEAMRKNAVEMRKVIDKIKALGIVEKDIQTTGITLNARYDWNESLRKQVFRGYQATNMVSVKLRNIDATGSVLDALVAAGATDINGPNFSIDNDEEAKSQARENAVKRGQERAEAYARMLGYGGVRVLEINETVTASQPYMRERVTTVAVQEAAADTAPVQPGQIATGVSITIKYEMVSGQ